MRKVFSKRGFTLMETLVGVLVFTLVALAAYRGFSGALNALKILEIKNTAIQIANEQIEIIRNMPYDDIGIVDGLPEGKLTRIKYEDRNDSNFKIVTTIRNIDLPFDGTIGGTPNDTSPADNKLAEIEVVCEGCKYSLPTILTANIAPKNLETQGNNGALFIQVVNAVGAPIEGVTVNIENLSTSSPFTIVDETNINGMLQIVDAPTGTNAYSVRVFKDGYSTDKTYPLDDINNPIPNIPHANVLQGLVTQLSFSIDLLSRMNIRSKNYECGSVANVDFNMSGSKTIGYEVFKYDKNLTTDIDGELYLSAIEWDSYYLNMTDSSYFLAGTNPMLPVNIEPDSDEDIDILVAERNPRALLVNIKDAGSGLPISDAEVTLTRGASIKQKVTGRGYFYQTDWSGGPGQLDFEDETQYYSDNNYLESNDPSGEIKLLNLGTRFFTNAVLTSSVIDTGTSSNFSNLSWAPFDQNTLTGSEPIKVQFASGLENTPTTTWSFIGPDGSEDSYYTVSGSSLNENHNGDRFARYKIFLNTEDDSVTPIISDFDFTYSSDCVPPGQVYFDSLALGDYILNIDKDGYQDYSTIVPITEDWQSIIIELTP